MALLPRFLVEEELADGKLVIPWQHAMSSSDAYYLAYPEHSAEVPKVRDFVKWMLEQVDHPATTDNAKIAGNPHH
ncbi:DNA-binding transcriptional activator GcvA [compost metagenome]